MQEALDRIRSVVDGSPSLGALLVEQAAAMPERAFGSRHLSALQFLDVYLEEAASFAAIVEPFLFDGVRVLEVGGGLGLFHALLAARGVDVTSVEPAERGFSLFRRFAVGLLAGLGVRAERYVDAVGESLPFPDAAFDLVVSSNVLEHVGDVEAVLREMYRVIRPGGRALNACPNYLVPYEPHYRVPVLPCAVQLTGRVVWRRFRHDALWRSLNGVNAWQVSRTVRRLPGARLTFQRGFSVALERVAGGGLIAARHRALSRLALAAPVRRLLRAVPGALTSPMIFEIAKPEALSSAAG